jgi:hypothetical protein
VCFGPSGIVTVQPVANDCDDSVSITNAQGATVYIRTIDALYKYKLVIFKLTGLPRLIDTW